MDTYPNKRNIRGKESELLDQIWCASKESERTAIATHLLCEKLNEVAETISVNIDSDGISTMIAHMAPGFTILAKSIDSASESSTNLASELRTSTESLIKELQASNQTATQVARSLMYATWALVLATIALIVVTAVH